MRRINVGDEGNEIFENGENLASTFQSVTVNSSTPPDQLAEFPIRWVPLVLLVLIPVIVLRERKIDEK